MAGTNSKSSTKNPKRLSPITKDRIIRSLRSWNWERMLFARTLFPSHRRNKCKRWYINCKMTSMKTISETILQISTKIMKRWSRQMIGTSLITKPCSKSFQWARTTAKTIQLLHLTKLHRISCEPLLIMTQLCVPTTMRVHKLVVTLNNCR